MSKNKQNKNNKRNEIEKSKHEKKNQKMQKSKNDFVFNVKTLNANRLKNLDEFLIQI